MNERSEKRSHRIDDALNVAPLILPTLEQLSVSTVGDLLSLDLESVRSIKGVGVARVDAVIDAIEQARIYSGEEPDDSSGDFVPDAAKSRELIFVPSLLRNTFKQHAIANTSHLFRLVPRELENQSGWGDKKIMLVVALQRLHRALDEVEPDALVAEVVPDVLLPETSIGRLTIQAFVDEQASSQRLAGAKSDDYVALEMLLSTVTSSDGDASCLHGFAGTELHWRDVPLTFSKRVADFLDANLIDSLEQLDQLASLGRCDNRNGKSITTEGHYNFGNTSRNELRQKLRVLSRIGLSQHQRQVCCSLADLPDPEIRWDGIPIEFPARLRKFLNDHGLQSIKQVHAFAMRPQLRDAATGEWKDATSVENFSLGSLRDLRSELQKLAELGLDEYRFGEAGRPKTIRALIDAVKDALRDRDFEALMLRAQGLTLEEMSDRIGLSRERARQLAKRAVENASAYASVARGFLEPVIAELKSEGVLSLARASTLLNCEESSTIRFLTIIAEYEYEINDKTISLFDGVQRRSLEGLLRHQLEKGELPQENGNIVLCKLLAKAPKKHVEPIEPALNAGIDSLAIVAACRLIGKRWLSGYIGSQLIAAGVNGLFFDEIDTGGSFESATELKELLDDTADVLHDGRFRRANDIYRSGDEILGFLKNSSEPLSVPQLIEMSSQTWFQSHLTGRYLSPLYEAILIDRGLYVHVENLNLSVRDVKRIANWGAELLHGEKSSVSAEVLLELFQESGLGLSVETPYQLVSIIAKHPDVKRLSNTLQLAHKDFFDDSTTYLVATDPDLAAEFHPTRNDGLTVENVKPASNALIWWQCVKGHEFQASPAYRTRSSRNCPGCQPTWTLARIRLFVKSLQSHLAVLTPAELYVIFQQSGLWKTGGKARGFVKALATGRFPQGEIDNFVDGKPSIVDEFLSDNRFDLTDVVVDEDIPTFQSEPAIESETRGDKEADLPRVRTKQALDALDCQVLASTDSEAAEFLVASAKAKIWSHAYRDSASAVAEAESHGESQYSREVADSFLHEFREATDLNIPDGYSFDIDGEICEPNLMQRHVAIQVRDRLRYGNWSGTGAGKTLSAILATRVVGAGLTVVCCPNAVVGQTTDGWATEIKRVYPDSEVAVKTMQPQWSGTSHRYLVLNYEQFQQPDSEPDLKQFLKKHAVDFIVIDEVHYAKQRFADQMSKRKRLIQALVAGAAEVTPELRVLGLSATPVINNLQEGRSLVEMITGIEHDDIDVKPTVHNCMRLHQKLMTLGTRWQPNYSAILDIETTAVDCADYVDEIRNLGKNSSPLDIEKILTRARLPKIIETLQSNQRAIIYTHYVEEIDRILYDELTRNGYRVGFYTGAMKDGLDAFKSGKIDVLIGSSAIGTGVDGLQHCCSQLIVNVLPWTNAEFEQLIGRVWRQGQTKDRVKVLIPVTFADVNGERWSYCESKLARIRYKKSIADAAVDGAVPQGNLRSPAQAQRDIMKWLERLEEGRETTIVRRRIVVPLSGDRATVKTRLTRYGDFSQMNNRWNSTHSEKLGTRLRENPEEWEQYHTHYRDARAKWAIVPVDEMISWCMKREGYVIADFGCGEALLSEAVRERH
ncbi:MAG: DEAD/DEAH box helicase family protein, partial [Planctomycetales bacterium]|nr:DEAD/DEAH box helicase family protein [Planctomycetales bacterium]